MGHTEKWDQITIIKTLTKTNSAAGKMCIINVKQSIMHAARHGERSTPSISELRFVVATCQFPNDWDALEVKLLLYLLSSSLYPNSIMIISRARRRNWASKYLNLGYSYTKTIIFSTAFFGCYKLENFCSSCFRRFFSVLISHSGGSRNSFRLLSPTP